MLAITETKNENIVSTGTPPFCCQNGCDNGHIIAYRDTERYGQFTHM